MKRFIFRLVGKLFFKIINSEGYAYYEKQHWEAWGYKNLGSFGKASMLPKVNQIKNPKYIKIGRNFNALSNLRIEAWDSFMGESYTPEIIIGDYVFMNSDIHIGAIDKIIIGDHVLIASRVFITDHSHGQSTLSDLKKVPSQRPLYSKGPVIIGNNVLIGEGVCILSGVTIGDNCIIGANAVVNKSFAANSIIAGIPAKVIK